MKAILLAGGQGTRLRPLTLHTPKPIVPIFNRPFLTYQIDLLRQIPDITEIILSLNYQPRRIEEVFGDGSSIGIPIRYVVEPEPRGTAGAIKFCEPFLDDTVVVFNGDVLTQIDLRAVIALHRERKARATIVLTPVENPTAYGLVETDADGNVTRFLEKPKKDEITCDTINAGIYVLEPDTFDRIPEDQPWSIERSYFPSLVERKETFVAYVYRGYWIDIGTPEKYEQVHRDIMDGRFQAPPFDGEISRAVVSPSAKIDPDVTVTGPCFIDDDVVIKAGSRIGPYSVIGAKSHIEEHVRIDGSIVWPQAWIGRDSVLRDAIVGRNCHIGRNAQLGATTLLGDRTVLTDYTRAEVPSAPPAAAATGSASMNVNPGIFKAYDIRGLYPEELNEDVARLAGRAFVAYLQAKRIGVSCDMRVSSPTMKAAFIDGAREQGADVVDYGMLGTDMIYYAVCRDGLDGGAQITASHNPKQYNGMKLVRQQAFPLSGDAGISDMREMIVGGTIPAPHGPRGSLTSVDIVDDYVQHMLGFIDTSVIKPFHAVLDAGSGMGGLVAPKLFDKLPCKTTRLCFDIDGTFPNHEANPLIEENRQDITAKVIETKADIGIAWDGDADCCFFIDGTGEFVAGDFITALLAEAFLIKTPGAKIVYDLRASYAVKDVAAKYGGTALMNRVGHAFFKKRMREENAVFGGEVTGHYYFKDFYYADNGFLPALLLLELMSKKNCTLADLLAPLREKYFISGEINTKVAHMDLVNQKLDGLAEQYKDGNVYRLDGVSAEFPDWHFNVRASNTEPLLRLNVEATTPALMAEKRDAILGFIRS